ncbi:MAG: hypothetical protein Q6362_000380 [Candidatus Wukongarchaeota archaeon]|nr:hypothetical protein [Candidatus Wukongarchaeota archaeon]
MPKKEKVKKIDEKKMEKTESMAAKLTQYNLLVGKRFLFLLPPILALLTAMTLWQKEDPDAIRSLTVAFAAVLAVFAVNSIFLAFGTLYSQKAFQYRLDYERQRGRPVDSLRGFASIKSDVDGVLSLLKLLSLLSFIVLGVYGGLLFKIYGELDSDELSGTSQNLAFAGFGLILVTFGLSTFVKSLKMDIQDVTGLSDFYRPTNHELFLDKFFGDVFVGHLDPVTKLKWDEFVGFIDDCLKPEFKEDMLKKEPGEAPVAFAIEKLLYLLYLEHSLVLDREQVLKEVSEILDLSKDVYDIEEGAMIGGRRYFGKNDVCKLFDFMEENSPGFFNIVDRLQLELVDNIKMLAEDPIYLDVSADEVCEEDTEVNLIALLYNNSPEPKDYRLRIYAPGFEPERLEVNLHVEGAGEKKIPKEEVPFYAEGADDIVGIASRMLKDADSIWLTLEPRKLGTQTLQIFLETPDGYVIEGKTLSVSVIKNFMMTIKRSVGKLSFLGGIASPVLRVFLM